MILSPEEIRELRRNASPQPLGGEVPELLLCAWLQPTNSLFPEKSPVFAIWDSRQTAGYLTATASSETFLRILRLESIAPGFLKTLLGDTHDQT